MEYLVLPVVAMALVIVPLAIVALSDVHLGRIRRNRHVPSA